MFVLFVMIVTTGTAIVIDRGLAWWRGSRWRRVASRDSRDAGGDRC
jgi:hypothetical protein